MNKKGALTVGSALLLVLCIDGLLFAGQMAVHDVAGQLGIGENLTFTHYKNSYLYQYDKGNYTISTNGSINELLSANPSVSPDTGDIFTDTFTSIKNWFTSISNGFSTFTSILGGPYTFVSMLGLPGWFNMFVGGIWYGLTLFLLVAFIAGRQE